MNMNIIEIPTGRPLDNDRPDLDSADGAQDYLINWLQRHVETNQATDTESRPRAKAGKSSSTIVFLDSNDKTTKLPAYVTSKLDTKHKSGIGDTRTKGDAKTQPKRYTLTKTPVYQIPEEMTTSHTSVAKILPGFSTNSAQKNSSKRFRISQSAGQSLARRYSIDLQDAQSDVNDDATSASYSTSRRPSRASSATWYSGRRSSVLLFRSKTVMPSFRSRSGRASAARTGSSASSTAAARVPVRRSILNVSVLCCWLIHVHVVEAREMKYIMT